METASTLCGVTFGLVLSVCPHRMRRSMAGEVRREG